MCCLPFLNSSRKCIEGCYCQNSSEVLMGDKCVRKDVCQKGRSINHWPTNNEVKYWPSNCNQGAKSSHLHCFYTRTKKIFSCAVSVLNPTPHPHKMLNKTPKNGFWPSTLFGRWVRAPKLAYWQGSGKGAVAVKKVTFMEGCLVHHCSHIGQAGGTWHELIENYLSKLIRGCTSNHIPHYIIIPTAHPPERFPR